MRKLLSLMAVAALTCGAAYADCCDESKGGDKASAGCSEKAKAECNKTAKGECKKGKKAKTAEATKETGAEKPAEPQS